MPADEHAVGGAAQVQDELKGRLRPSSTSSPTGTRSPGRRRHRLPVRRRAPGGAALGPLRRQERRMAPARRDSVFIFSCGAEKRCVESARTSSRRWGSRTSNESRLRSTRTYQRTSARTSSTGATTLRRSPRSSNKRIKHAFVFYYRPQEERCDRLGGEMIDLSDGRTRRVQAVDALRQDCGPASTKVPSSACREDLLSVPHGFLLDLEKMIHHEINRAYKALKYENAF